jgi:rubrerythrin
MDFQQSKTYNNLLNAYQRDLMSGTLYSIYSDRARLDGYIEIANIYDITGRNEKEHARIWLRQLNSGNLPDTQTNLLNSANDELSDGDLYREYARVAREEGYNDLASLFNGVANIELNHDLRFRSLYDNIVRNEVFCKPQETLWICMQCGNIMSGTCAPEVCPVCGFPQGYYRVYESGT